MSSKTTLIHLTDAELILLDGRCSEKVQEQVDAALKRVKAADKYADLTDRQAGFIADVVSEAEESGKLVYYSTHLSHCGVCEKSPEPRYVPLKSGPNRGLPNYKKPRYLQGVELADRFVRMTGHVTVGCCLDCMKELKPYVVEALKDVEAELPEWLRSDGTGAYTRYANRKCTKCGWEGHDGQMRRRPTIVGNGTYPSGCPQCDAYNGLGFSEVKIVDGYQIVKR